MYLETFYLGIIENEPTEDGHVIVQPNFIFVLAEVEIDTISDISIYRENISCNIMM